MLMNKLGLLMLLLVMTPAVYGAKEGAGPAIGKPAPGLVGRTLDGASYSLRNDQDSPKVINFFWVECKPCRKEMPELAKLEKQYPGVKFISVHTEQVPAENVTQFVKSLAGAPANIVLTAGGLKEDFNYLGLPHTMVLGSDNVVLLNLVGYTPANMRQLQKTLQKLTQQ